jgi:hypothetical protein
MMEASVYLSSRVGITNRVGLRRIGPGSLFFRGLFSKGKVKSVDADFVVLDELDEAKETNVHFATDRLMHSDLQWVIALSQPSVPGFGISKRFEDTDQRFWHVICPACGTYNCLELNWQADINSNFIPIPKAKRKCWPDGATHYRGCKKCQAPLDMSKGEWVAKFPKHVKRGYHLSQLFTSIKPPEATTIASHIMALYEQKRRTQLGLENFVISVLGFPFAGGHARVTDEVLDFCEQDYGFSFSGSGTFMGIDQGDVLSVIIGLISGNYFKVIYAEQTEVWGHLAKLIERFGVHYCVIDAQPNKKSAKEFALKHPNRVSIQYFGAHEVTKGVELYEGKIEVPKVNVDRTETLDGTVDRLEAGQIQLPSRAQCSGAFLATLEDIRRHLKQLISKNEVGQSGIMRKVYLRGGGVENHYGMALNNAIVAAYGLGLSNPGPMVAPVWRGYRDN